MWNNQIFYCCDSFSLPVDFARRWADSHLKSDWSVPLTNAHKTNHFLFLLQLEKCLSISLPVIWITFLIKCLLIIHM